MRADKTSKVTVSTEFPRGTIAPGVTLTRISGSKGMQRRVAGVARKGEKTAPK